MTQTPRPSPLTESTVRLINAADNIRDLIRQGYLQATDATVKRLNQGYVDEFSCAIDEIIDTTMGIDAGNIDREWRR